MKALWSWSCLATFSCLKTVHFPRVKFRSITSIAGDTIVCVILASRCIFRSLRLQTTVMSLSLMRLSSLTEMSFWTTMRSGLISVSLCSRILSEWPSTVIFYAKSVKWTYWLWSSYPMSLKSRILGSSRLVYMRLLAMLLVITTPFTIWDLELSFQSMILTLMYLLISIPSLSMRDEGWTCSTALSTKLVSMFSHLSTSRSQIKICSATTFWICLLEYYVSSCGTLLSLGN